MINIFHICGNEITIKAPGSSNINKIKNDLIVEINILLLTKYRLFSFYICRKLNNSLICKTISQVHSKYLAVNPLDKMFFHCSDVDEKDLEEYRKIMDPHHKMDDVVFRELCCIENTDIEYFAIDVDIQDFISTIDGTSTKTVARNIENLSSVYVSLFGFSEMRLKVNNMSLMEKIMEIVNKYCVEGN